jgi:hypothetical protein
LNGISPIVFIEAIPIEFYSIRGNHTIEKSIEMDLPNPIVSTFPTCQVLPFGYMKYVLLQPTEPIEVLAVPGIT